MEQQVQLLEDELLTFMECAACRFLGPNGGCTEPPCKAYKMFCAGRSDWRWNRNEWTDEERQAEYAENKRVMSGRLVYVLKYGSCAKVFASKDDAVACIDRMVANLIGAERSMFLITEAEVE